MVKGISVYTPCFVFAAIHKNLEKKKQFKFSSITTRITHGLETKTPLQIIWMLSIDKLQPFENFPFRE